MVRQTLTDKYVIQQCPLFVPPSAEETRGLLKQYGRGIQMVTRPVSALALELSLASLTRMDEAQENVNSEEARRGVRRGRDADDVAPEAGRRRLRLWNDLPYFEELHDDRFDAQYEHEAYYRPVRRSRDDFEGRPAAPVLVLNPDGTAGGIVEPAVPEIHERNVRPRQ